MIDPERRLEGCEESVEPIDPRDQELAEALEEYLAGVERGQPCAVEELMAHHPAVADRLREAADGLRLVSSAASSLRETPGGVDDLAANGSREIGEFRVLRELGRGGMGIVYEAEQISLGRKVALKVLPFAAVLDEKQVRRFKHEAQAAAQLHHSNIVPVHAVGCDRGVHYYAMQLIEGRSLAEVKVASAASGYDGGCRAATNTNADEGVDITDPIAVLGYLFLAGPPPAAPFPNCGPGEAEADDELGCAAPAACP